MLFYSLDKIREPFQFIPLKFDSIADHGLFTDKFLKFIDVFKGKQKKDIGASYMAPPGGLQKKSTFKEAILGYLFEETNVYYEAVHKLNTV